MTRDTIEYSEHAPVAAKGKVEPVPVWAAVQATARVKVEREARAPLVGRRRELSLLRETLERAHSEREPQLVTLVGVPGIGKSRLVYELFKTLEQGPELVYWRHGRSLPYGEGVTFWALSEIVKAQAGILETDDPTQAEAKLRSAVEAIAGDQDPRWLERNLRPLIGLEAAVPAEDRRTETFAAWRRFLESLAEQRPLVLVFEDLHWADDALLDFVDHLVDWASGVPLLVLATARPELLERRPGWSGGKPNATTLSLPPLADEETAELVHALLETPVLAASTQAELLTRAGGNPLYAEEFARLVAEGRPPDELPESVQGLIAARLDALAAEDKQLLQAAAVVGKVFWLGSISAVSATPRWTAEDRLHALERKDFVRRERRSSVAGEIEYAFRHLLIRDVAYVQIPRAERGEKHQLTAEWIESLGRPDDHAELLAQHYLSALELVHAVGREDSALAERARAAARDAGDRALGLNSFAVATDFFSRALDLSGPDDPGRAELLFRMGAALHLADDERARRILDEAAEALIAAGDPKRAAEALALLSTVWWYRGDRQRSHEHLARARELVGDEDSEARARVLARVARTCRIEQDDVEALRAATEALAVAERLGLEDIRVDALSTMGTSRLEQGDPDGAADVERSIEIALRSNNPDAARSYNNLAYPAFLDGDVKRGRSLVDESFRLAERFGDPRMLRFGRGLRPQYDYYAGAWDNALVVADAFIEECEATDSHYLEPTVRAPRAVILLARGGGAPAALEAARAVELGRQRRDPQVYLPPLAIRLRVEFEHGRLDPAADIAAELLEQRPNHAIFPPAVELAWTAGSFGTTEDVRRWVRAIHNPSRWSDAALAILDGQFERAADLFAEIGSLPDEARARLRAGSPENARRALDFYRSVGATRYIREAEALLGDASEVSA